jgi:hypothetical protein
VPLSVYNAYADSVQTVFLTALHSVASEVLIEEVQFLSATSSPINSKTSNNITLHFHVTIPSIAAYLYPTVDACYQTIQYKISTSVSSGDLTTALQTNAHAYAVSKMYHSSVTSEPIFFNYQVKDQTIIDNTANTNNNDDALLLSTGAIIGVAVGGLVFYVVCAGACTVICKWCWSGSTANELDPSEEKFPSGNHRYGEDAMYQSSRYGYEYKEGNQPPAEDGTTTMISNPARYNNNNNHSARF